MNRNSRRALLRAGRLGLLAPLATTAILAACTNNPLQNNVTVDFSTAQRWSATLASAIHAFFTEATAALGTKLAPNIANIVSNADATIQAANTQVQAATSGTSTIIGLINSIIGQVTTFVGALAPIWSPIAAAQPDIALALAVLTAFVNSLAMVVPAIPAKLSAAAARAPAH